MRLLLAGTNGTRITAIKMATSNTTCMVFGFKFLINVINIFFSEEITLALMALFQGDKCKNDRNLPVGICHKTCH